MRIPEFIEANHPLILSLRHQSDQELLRQYQEFPEQGKFFAAIFYRYQPIVYSLITQAVVNPEISNYLLAASWRQFFYELRGLVINLESPLNSLQDWLIYHTNVYLKQVQLPEIITYDIYKTPPPLWCYVQEGLDSLHPLLRFILVMTEKFNWTQTRLASYLQAEGETISVGEIVYCLEQAYQYLESNLPEDIRLIYLDS